MLTVLLSHTLWKLIFKEKKLTLFSTNGKEHRFNIKILYNIFSLQIIQKNCEILLLAFLPYLLLFVPSKLFNLFYCDIIIKYRLIKFVGTLLNFILIQRTKLLWVNTVFIYLNVSSFLLFPKTEKFCNILNNI